MTPQALLKTAIEPGLLLLPANMRHPLAKVEMLAIALQESRCKHRRQINGPARGYWQFEQGGGVRGVLNHPASKAHIQNVLTMLDYPLAIDSTGCYVAIEHNDMLAACFARLLLWTLPTAMPATAEQGWDTYIAAWRPGKPHPGTWASFYAQAQEIIAQEA